VTFPLGHPFSPLPTVTDVDQQDVTGLHAALARLPQGLLGYAEVTASQTGMTGTTDLTGLTVTVTIKPGRRIVVTGKGQGRILDATPPGRAIFSIYEGATELQRFIEFSADATGQRMAGQASVILTPSAGSHTYKLVALLAAGDTLDSEADTVWPAFIMVEDIGPA
jgi:hypothetical protein